MCLSSERSATSRFSRALSSSSAAQPQFTHAQVRVLLLPDVERGFADAELAADVRGWRPAFDLAEGIGDLLFGEFRLLNGPRSLSEGPSEAAIFL
jgi:hypothetical protein